MATSTMTVHAQTHSGTPAPVGSNQGKIAADRLGWLQPTSKDMPLPEMRKRLKEDGYLFVKNLIPREDVLKVRKDYFALHVPTGILEPDTDPEEGIFNSKEVGTAHSGIGATELPATALQVKTLTDAHSTPEYLQFLEHANLRSFVRDLMGWDNEVLLKRTMLRHNAPGAMSTAVHYDKLFLRGGEAYFLTAWVPIGDISQTGGGLIYLSQSATLGKSFEDDFTRRAADLSPEQRINAFNVNMAKNGHLSQNAAEFSQKHDSHHWLATNYEAGDVVFHDPHTIHTSCMNEDPEGKIRLSTDLRFYREGSDLDQRWMKLWNPTDGL